MVGNAPLGGGKGQPVATYERRAGRKRHHPQAGAQMIAHMAVARLKHVFVARVLVPVAGVIVILKAGQNPRVQQGLTDEQRAVSAPSLAALQVAVGRAEP